MSTPLLSLDNGVEMPALGLGVFQTPSDETIAAVAAALDTGYRHVDTAAAYGNEREVGEAIRRSGLDRAEVFVETKVWISDYGYEETLHAFDKSAGKLGVDQIDLFILHQALPGEFEQTIGAYRALEKLLADGQVPAIGVSNVMPHHLARLAEAASTLPAVNQIEVHTPTSGSRSCSRSTPSTASSRRRGHRSAGSPTTGTGALARRPRREP